MRKSTIRKTWLGALVLLLLACLSAGCGAAEAETETETTAYERGLQAIAAGDYRTAMGAFQDAIRTDRMVAKGYRGQGIVYLREGNYNNAVTMFARCLDSLTDSEEDRALRQDVMLYQIEAYQKNGQIDLARDLCEDLLAESGREAQALILRGELSAQENDMEAAEKDFRAAVARDPSYENYLRIYETYEEKNLRADGAEFLFEALKKEARTSEDEYEVGRIYYVLNEIDAAKEHLSRASADGEQRAGLLLARISLDSGDVSGARSIYRSFLENGDQPSTAYNGLVLCDIADQNLNGALENVRAGLSCGDNTAREMLLFNEVIIYERLLDFDTARQKMTEFLQIYPENRDAQRENLFLQNR